MSCEEAVYSEQTYDYITDFSIENTGDLSPVFCYAKIGEKYDCVYLNSNLVPSPEKVFFPYPNMPKLYALQDTEGAAAGAVFQPQSLREAGILQTQQGSLQLSGQGVILCFIDTGIDYRQPIFMREDGSTRILSIWDQSIPDGPPPAGFLYGTQYTEEQINQALSGENPYDLVPHKDTSGHGTALACAAAASRQSDGFLGAAPEADLVVVKLKQAKQYLREYYMIPPGAAAYQENDIMAAVAYCDGFARLLQRPVVICLGLGCGLGDHMGNGFLAEYLDSISVKRSRCVVLAGGNEGSSAHHYVGNVEENRPIELQVSEGTEGFCLEFWGQNPDRYALQIKSPGGERLPVISRFDDYTVTYGFVFEETTVTIGADAIETSTGKQLIRMRFVKPTPGIWTFYVSSLGEVSNGSFSMWLPNKQFLAYPVYFLRPNPDTTITDPGFAKNAITVTYYDGQTGALAPDSGRGFGADGGQKPDLAAPGVMVSTIRGEITGSGVAAALTAGAVALYFQWAVVQNHNRYVESKEIKAFFILGAKREDFLTYPSREWGYGKLNLYQSFQAIAQKSN